MSHATYCFLIDIDDPDEPIGEMATEVHSIFEGWADKHCDENNWFQTLSVVLDTGREIKLCEDGDYRGRDEFGEDIAAMPQDQRWEWARLFALKCVANECSLGGRSPWSFGNEVADELYWDRFDLLLEQILHEVPSRLSEMWAKGALIPEPDASQNEELAMLLETNRRARLSDTMSKLLHSIRDGHVPFSDSGTPYDYRAFDLTSDDDEEPAHRAILFVDIHT
jgi:hypothetical protein